MPSISAMLEDAYTGERGGILEDPIDYPSVTVEEAVHYNLLSEGVPLRACRWYHEFVEAYHPVTRIEQPGMHPEKLDFFIYFDGARDSSGRWRPGARSYILEHERLYIRCKTSVERVLWSIIVAQNHELFILRHAPATATDESEASE